jgi:antitoxin (DNA-binding transcriptional repressor) of toxin-antitoxin stability system
MGVTHIPEAEAARSLSALIVRAHAGEEIVIDNGGLTVALTPSPAPRRRSVSECIALARKHEETTGEAPVMDADFAADIEEIVRQRKPWNPPAWD